MHAVSHTLAHRGPPATRSRARWQPYNSLQQSLRSPSSSSSSSSSALLHTPPSSVSTPPSTQPTPLTCHASLGPQPFACALHTPASVHKECHARDVQKTKFVVGLVDQAVKSLCEIWHPNDIPSVFLTSSRATVVASTSSSDVLANKRLHGHHSHPLLHTRSAPLVSPGTPSAQSSPSLPPAGQGPDDGGASNLVPIKGFVHEVLRRSRTSGSVLQTALCYLEAIRTRVPELVEKERAGEGVRGEPDNEARIVKADESEHYKMTLDFVTHPHDAAPSANASQQLQEIMETVRIDDEPTIPGPACSFSQAAPPLAKPTALPAKRRAAAEPLPALPALPSPLLCPRRAFLASLILASKFTQDRCYSNRAWAKLSGLPPREIGRCERALGDALGWRLWVGKAPPPAPAPAVLTRSPVARCKSDGELLFGPRVSAPSQLEPEPAKRSLRRHATVPDGCFSTTHVHPAPPVLSLDALMYDAPAPLPDLPSLAPAAWDSPATPPLSSSPSSDSDSSGGGRTVQMASFVDVDPAAAGVFKVSPPALPLPPYDPFAHAGEYGYAFAQGEPGVYSY